MAWLPRAPPEGTLVIIALKQLVLFVCLLGGKGGGGGGELLLLLRLLALLLPALGWGSRIQRLCVCVRTSCPLPRARMQHQEKRNRTTGGVGGTSKPKFGKVMGVWGSLTVQKADVAMPYASLESLGSSTR